MKHKGLRVTPEQLKRMRSTKSIEDVARKHYKGRDRYNSIVDQYFVHYKLVRTEDLIVMMRRLTIFDNFLADVKLPKKTVWDRITYLELIEEYVDVKINEQEFDDIKILMRNQDFVDNQRKFIKLLKDELATREHIPNKQEKKIVRQLKAKGQYIID